MRSLVLGLLTALFATTLSAAYQVENVQLQWSAFKTPQKKAVNGTFKDVSLVSHATQSIQSALLGTKVIINTKSVSSGHEGRDMTLVQSYFDLFAGSKIEATIVKVTSKNIVLALAMNGKKGNVVMNYAFIDPNTIEMEGSMDMLSFGLGKALKSINEACYDLHKGKTWSDVTLKASFNI